MRSFLEKPSAESEGAPGRWTWKELEDRNQTGTRPNPWATAQRAKGTIGVFSVAANVGRRRRAAEVRSPEQMMRFEPWSGLG